MEVADPFSGSLSTIPGRIGIWKGWFLRRRENWSTQGKTSRNKGENQQQIQPTYGVMAGTWTWAAMLGGECPQHCANLAPPEKQTTLIQHICKDFPSFISQEKSTHVGYSAKNVFQIVLVWSVHAQHNKFMSWLLYIYTLMWTHLSSNQSMCTGCLSMYVSHF